MFPVKQLFWWKSMHPLSQNATRSYLRVSVFALAKIPRQARQPLWGYCLSDYGALLSFSRSDFHRVQIGVAMRTTACIP